MRKINKKHLAIYSILALILLGVILYSILHVTNRSQPTNAVENTSEKDYTSYSAKWNETAETVEIRNNYRVYLELNPDQKSYTAQMTVDVYNDSSDPWNAIYFRDYPSQFSDKENGQISEITDLRDRSTEKNLVLTRDTDPTVFSVQLDQALLPQTTITLSMTYKANIPLLNARFGYQKLNENTLDFYLGNSLPVLCPYDNGKFQYYPYFAVGESFYSRMANYDVKVAVPSEYTVIATGDETETSKDGEKTTHHYIANAVRDYLLVIGNDYQSETKEVDGIKVNSYYHTGREESGKEALNTAAKTIKDCNYRLGKYPYSQFSVVEAQMEMLGMEYPQIVLITMAEEGVPSSVHEIMHQWFYGLVGSNAYTSAWIDESIATYLANPGLVEHSGYITKPYNSFASDPDYTLAMYFCGASMYNRLEEVYGKSTMNAFMRDLLEQHAYKEISTQELVNLLVQYFGKDNDILKEYIEPQYLENL